MLRAAAGRFGRVVILASLVVLASGLTAATVAEASTTSAVATTTVLSVSPREAITTQTPVSLAATVAPSAAGGYVRFIASGRTLASAPVVGGTAAAPTVYLPLGPTTVTAVFSPTDPSRFAPSTSADTTLRVTAVPNVWVTNASGSVIAGSAPVTPGQSYDVNVSGFPVDSLVTVRLGSRLIVPGIRVDASGAGSMPLDLSASFAPGVYTLTAEVGDLSTAVAFYVVPPAGATTTPEPTVVVPTSTAADPPADTSQNPAPGLADTGGEPLALVAVGLLLVALGTALHRAGRVEVGRRELRV